MARKFLMPNLVDVENLAARGLYLGEIAASLGFSDTTLRKRRKQFSEVSAAIARGQKKGQAKIANVLFEAAAKGDINAAKFYLARRCGWSETVNNQNSGEIGVNVSGAIDVKRDGVAGWMDAFSELRAAREKERAKIEKAKAKNAGKAPADSCEGGDE